MRLTSNSLEQGRTTRAVNVSTRGNMKEALLTQEVQARKAVHQEAEDNLDL